MEPSKSRNGQSLLEAVIALGLLALTGTAGFGLFAHTVGGHTETARREQARRLVQEGIEGVRSIRDTQWDGLASGTYGITRSEQAWAFSETPDVTDNLFTRTVTVSEGSAPDEWDIAVEVEWQSVPSRSASMHLVTRLTNWRELETWGDWGQPVIVGSLDIGPEGKATGIARRGNNVFLTAESGSGNKPSFFVVDVSAPSSPFILDSLITNDDLRDVQAPEEGSAVYTTGTGSDTELRVFEAADPSQAIQITTRDLDAGGYHAMIAENRLYVGAANGIHIFDLSDPTNPLLLGSLNVGAEVRGVAVSDNIAYLATSHDTQELMAVDVSVPETPIVVWTYNTPGSRDGLTVDVRDARLYLGTKDNPSTNPELYLFDRTDPAAPTFLNSIDIGGDLNQLKAAGPFVFMATNASNEEFKIYRVSDASQPTKEAGLNLAQSATDIDFNDNTIYISLRSNDAFQIIQSSP